MQILINALQANGFVTDQSDIGLSSHLIERWSEECEQFLRSAGYTGGTISDTGKFFENHSAIYMLYDCSLFSLEEALDVLDQLALWKDPG